MTVHVPAHDLSNQPPPFVDVDLVALDQPLRDSLAAHGLLAETVGTLGQEWGTAERLDLARLANENGPKLRTHDARGERIDRVEFHPAYHELMRASVATGLHCSGFEGGAGAHLARAARVYVTSGVESGHVCPMTMTNAAGAALAAAPERLAEWSGRIRSRVYDPRPVPFWEKAGVTIGMGMTERQGGTDVRANTTQAEPDGPDAVALTGHKWFFSAPMCDAFLVLAQGPGGLSCFLVPRHRPDGSLNGLRLQRLKDKLGNRSNASSEVEFERAFAWPVGAPGRGVPTIIAMVQLTRLDCAVASAGHLRMAVAVALHHARHRTVFQRRLADQPAMRAVLADLALEAEAMTALTMALAADFDRTERDPAAAARARLLTPAVKMLVCKGAPALVGEALECLGGNGYVEEGPLARLYREAPLNAIWEGSGNIMALDVLRAAGRDPAGADEVVAGLAAAAGDLPGAREAAGAAAGTLRGRDPEGRARHATERLATLAAAAALARAAPSAIAEAYARTRLATPRPALLGTSELGPATDLLLERALAA